MAQEESIYMEKPYGFIYITTNIVNGMKYIGKKSYDKSGKWKHYLGSGIRLKRAIDVYGEENFTREIIEYTYNEKDACEKETRWISFYNATESEAFYNIASGGDGGNVTTGWDESRKNEYRELLRRIRKGKINLGKNNPAAKKVICLNYMKIFDSTKDAAKWANVNPPSIQQCASPSFPNTHTAGVDAQTGERLQWEYYEEGKTYEYKPFVRQKPISCKKIKCLNTGTVFDSLTDAVRWCNGTFSGLSYHLKKEKSFYYGKDPETLEPIKWLRLEQ